MFRRTINGNTDLWSIEAGRNILGRLTSDPARDYDAVWSSAGDRIVFNSDRNGVLNFYELSIAGGNASAETLLLETSEHKNTQDWSTDRRYLLYSSQSVTTGNDLWALPLFGDRQPMAIAQTAAHETRGRFSPDGRWTRIVLCLVGRSSDGGADRASGQLETDTPSVLFPLPPGPHRYLTNAAPYAVARDGQRFLINTSVEEAPPITVLLNWKPKD